MSIKAFYSSIVSLVALFFLSGAAHSQNGKMKYRIEKKIGANIAFTLITAVDCDGKVELRFSHTYDVRNIRFIYESNDMNGVNQTGAFNASAGNDILPGAIIFPAPQLYAWVQVTGEYKRNGVWRQFPEEIKQFYSRLSGASDMINVDYIATDAPPNNFEFTYTGDNLVTSNYMSFDNYSFSYNDGGQTINSSSSLENGETITNRFFCNTSSSAPDNQVGTNLSVQYISNTTPTHYPTLELFPENSFSLKCTYPKEVVITLDNLCDYLNPPTISPGPNEFRPIIHIENPDDVSLIPFVTSHKINYNWQSGESGNSTVQFDQNYTANYGNTHGNKTIKEFVTFKDDCTCEMVTTYNTNNPCMNMSGLSFSVVYEEGENHFEFTPAHYEGSASQGTPSVEINFGDGSPSVFPTTLDPIAHDFPGNGPYTVTQITTFPGFPPCTTSVTMTQDIILNNEYCCENFSLDNATTAYWISAWVMEGHAIQPKTYQNSYIEIEFLGGGTTVQPYQFHPTGDIIEGWQRIVGKFSIPTGAVKMNIHLASSGGSVDSYFDDVRVHPFNASMKSYVYDAETFWLTAELDDNNYATIYEYDNEGQLIRIKKETARGIMTIQESRSSNVIKYQE